MPRDLLFGFVLLAQHVMLTMVVCLSSGIRVETGFVNQILESGGQERDVARRDVCSPSVHDVLRQFVGVF